MSDIHQHMIDRQTPSTLLDGRLADLPPPETKRWVIRRKAAVVAAVARGVLTLEEACARYRLSVEEFTSWQRLIQKHGVAGLRTTRLQDYRAPVAAAP
jgi:hypothetical protein